MQPLWRAGLRAIEIVILSALILAPRCANYHDVAVGGNIYFTDADCYSRMTRVRICAEHPGSIIRHHDFENYPIGTTPHTTAPLDYLILGVAILLKPFTAQWIDLAGALISPLFALIGGWFLWWWLRRLRLRFVWAALILYAISPILVHGTELGRPDHQSLLMLLTMIGICAEWSLQAEQSSGWSVASGGAWALAIWVSAYEPVVLFLFILAVSLVQDRRFLFARSRRAGWIVFAGIIAIALLIERRIPSFAILRSTELFQNWSRTIGELHSVSVLDPIWFHWAGYLVLIAPILIFLRFKQQDSAGALPLFLIVLSIATFGLTIWQARWGYFFMTLFVIVLPALLEPFKLRFTVWVAFILSILPILHDWDEQMWPNESKLAIQSEHRNESIELRALSLAIRSPDLHPFLAPWWLSPEIEYWSGQPAVAGSSHESLNGIGDSAEFYLTENSEEARNILIQRKVDWVFAYDSERVVANSAAVLGRPIPKRPVCRTLDRTPAQAPFFVSLAGENPLAKLFRVVNNR